MESQNRKIAVAIITTFIGTLVIGGFIYLCINYGLFTTVNASIEIMTYLLAIALILILALLIIYGIVCFIVWLISSLFGGK